MDFSHFKLIEEVKKRPQLYSNERIERDVKVQLWKEIGAALYPDWHQLNKASAYDRVLFTQKKWRSFRDAYLRELRAQKSGIKHNRTVYKYFKQLLFLGGFDGNPDEIEDRNYIIQIPNTTGADDGDSSYDPLISAASASSSKKKPRKRKMKKESFDDDDNEDEDDVAQHEVEVPAYSLDVDNDTDNDRLFLLSFLPEMKQLPLNIKMWARAQIANVMQEAINSQFNNTVPGKGDKRIRKDSTE